MLKTSVNYSLSFPLFYKILVANALLITAFGYLMYQLAMGNPWGLFGMQMQVYTLTILSLSGFVLVNYAILKLALQPLTMLDILTNRLRNGEVGARAIKPIFSDLTVEIIFLTIDREAVIGMGSEERGIGET